MPKLVITHGGDTREVALHDGDTAGRSSANAVQLEIAEASRTHCRFTEESGSWFVEDLGSSNGTRVNGRRVTKFELQDGDEIQVGSATARFLLSEVSGEEDPSLEWGSEEISLEEVPYLLIGGAGREGETVAIPEGRLTVGRRARHMLVLKDASVSGDHAELVREGSRVTLRDTGSSNGTFVNGERVQETELSPGDNLRLGTVSLTFNVGDPAEATPMPAPASGQAAVEEALETGETAQFALHDVPRSRETVWNVLALVLVLALAGGAYWLVTWEGDGGSRTRSGARNVPGNILPDMHWSFETSELSEDPAGMEAGWVRDRVDRTGATREVARPVRSGVTAMKVERPEDTGPPTLAVFDKHLFVTGERAYRLRAWVSGGGEAAVPVVELRWLERDREDESVVYELARDQVRGKPTPGGWRELAGVVAAPGRASLVQVGVGLDGRGSVVFDDVSLVALDRPAGQEAQGGFLPVLGPHGTLRLTRYGRLVLDDVGLVAKTGEGRLLQRELLVPAERAPGRIAGALLGGRGALEVTLEVQEVEAHLTFEGPGLTACSGLRVPLASRRATAQQVTVIRGEVGERHAGPFGERPADHIVIGQRTRSGDDRVRISVAGEGGEPRPFAVSFSDSGARPVVHIHPGDGERLQVVMGFSFEEELKEARSLLARARSLAAGGKDGEAIRILDDVIARFAFETALEGEAVRLRNRLVTEAGRTLDALRQRADDAVFFRTPEKLPGVQQEVEAQLSRYQGTAMEQPFAELLRRVEAERERWSSELTAEKARRFVVRGRGYLKDGKTELARVFLRYVCDEMPESDWAGQAAAMLERLEDGGPEDGKK